MRASCNVGRRRAEGGVAGSKSGQLRLYHQHIPYDVLTDFQGGDMVNCLVLWGKVLASGGDGGQLLLRWPTLIEGLISVSE